MRRRLLSVPISIRIDVEQLEHIRSVARKQSHEQDMDISYVDLIRIAIAETYPITDGYAGGAIPKSLDRI